MEIVENEEDLRSYMRTAVKAIQTIQSCRFLSLGKSVKSMPSQTGKCPHSWYHGAYRTCRVSTQVTQWPFILRQTLSQKVQETIADYTKRQQLVLTVLV